MHSPETSPSSQRGRNVSHAPPLPLRFLHIRDPGEAKLPSHRKAVHTHAALYQASQDRTGPESHVPRRRSRKRKRKDHWAGESMIVELGCAQYLHLERRETLLPAELTGQSAYQSHFPSIGLLGAGRVDPFRTYPVPWDPFIPQLVDHYIVNMAIDMPELDEPDKPGLLRTRWFPMVLTEAATFQVIILLAASHLALLHNSKDNGPNLLQLKSKAISLTRNALAVDGPSDQLIGAVVKMASYEAMFGDQNSYGMHMTGLMKMIDMRGGLSSLGLNGMLARICVWIDRNSAMLHDTPVHFTSVPEGLSTEVNPSGFLAMR